MINKRTLAWGVSLMFVLVTAVSFHLYGMQKRLIGKKTEAEATESNIRAIKKLIDLGRTDEAKRRIAQLPAGQVKTDLLAKVNPKGPKDPLAKINDLWTKIEAAHHALSQSVEQTKNAGKKVAKEAQIQLMLNNKNDHEVTKNNALNSNKQNEIKAAKKSLAAYLQKLTDARSAFTSKEKFPAIFAQATTAAQNAFNAALSKNKNIAYAQQLVDNVTLAKNEYEMALNTNNSKDKNAAKTKAIQLKSDADELLAEINKGKTKEEKDFDAAKQAAVDLANQALTAANGTIQGLIDRAQAALNAANGLVHDETNHQNSMNAATTAKGEAQAVLDDIKDYKANNQPGLDDTKINDLENNVDPDTLSVDDKKKITDEIEQAINNLDKNDPDFAAKKKRLGKLQIKFDVTV